MRLWLLCVAVLLWAPLSTVAESLSVCSSGHFELAYSSEWTPVPSDYCAFVGNNNAKLILMERPVSLGGYDLSVFFDVLVSSTANGDGTTLQETRELTVDGHRAILLDYTLIVGGSPQNTVTVYVYAGGYFAALSLGSPTLERSELDAMLMSLTQHLTVSELPFLEDAAQSAFGDLLLSVRHVDDSGYIFIEADLHGSDADAMIANLEMDATAFLQQLRSLTDSSVVDFTEVSFQGYADVLDVYGTVSHDYVIQFWITEETLNKINFELFDPTNMDHIDLNRYLAPVMRK